MPSLKQLRTFLAVAKAESVTGASLSINLSQPAVTQSLSKLEAALSVELFSRTRTGAYVTEYGQILLGRVERLFEQIEAALCEPHVGPAFATRASVRPLVIRISFSQIRALIAVSEGSSFVDAARTFGLSQPSLQRAARELEQTLQRSLFQRTSAGMSVTRAGSELARRLNIAVREVGYAAEEIAAARGNVNPRICIGALPLAGMSQLALAIGDLLAEYPGADIEIRDGRYEPLLAELRSGKVDILYGILRCPPEIDDVQEIAMFRDEYRVAARHGHPLTLKNPLRVADLADYDWILPGPGNPRRKVVEILFANQVSEPRVPVVTSSIAAHKAILVTSDRLTLLTDSEVREQSHQLTALPISGLSPRRPEGVAIRKEWRPTPAQARFMELLRHHTRNWVATRPKWQRERPCPAVPLSQNL